MNIEFVFSEDFDTNGEGVADMVSEVKAFAESLPDDAILLHLRLPDNIDFNTATTNRIKWYMNQIREFLSVARPTVVTLCNQFDLTSDSTYFISADMDVPDEISKDTLMVICYILLDVIDESAPKVDTSVSEIILPN
jgi:hypothetical protein